MSLPNRLLLKELEPVAFAGVQLYPELYEKPFEFPDDGDARQIFYLTERQKRLGQKYIPWRDLTRTSFVEKADDTAVFTGINIGKKTRGSGISSLIFRHTIDYLEDSGLDVVRTSRIRKPLVALMLKRENWKPQSTRCQAEVLPDIVIEPRTPTIRFVVNRLEESQMKSRSSHGDFYHVAPDYLVKERVVDSEYLIALYTSYVPPRQNT